MIIAIRCRESGNSLSATSAPRDIRTVHLLGSPETQFFPFHPVPDRPSQRESDSLIPGTAATSQRRVVDC